MKTLDAVIVELENYPVVGETTLTFDVIVVPERSLNDALHYLKEYKNTDENYKKAIGHVIEVIDHYEKMVADYLAVNNPPLTWDELNAMEGKPVWIEYADDEEQTGWALIVKNPERPTFGKPKLFTFVRDGGRFYLTIAGYGKRWQAYRKEH